MHIPNNYRFSKFKTVFTYSVHHSITVPCIVTEKKKKRKSLDKYSLNE